MAEESTQNTPQKTPNSSASQASVARAFGSVGGAQANAKEEKETLVSYREGAISMSLVFVKSIDPVTRTVRDIPKINFIAGGNFVPLPLNGEWWSGFADKVRDMADALNGINVVSAQRDSQVNTAKERLKAYQDSHA